MQENAPRGRHNDNRCTSIRHCTPAASEICIHSVRSELAEEFCDVARTFAGGYSWELIGLVGALAPAPYLSGKRHNDNVAPWRANERGPAATAKTSRSPSRDVVIVAIVF